MNLKNPRSSPKGKVNVTGTVDPKIYRTIEELATSEKISRSSIINSAIAEGFKSPLFADRINRIRGLIR